MAIARPEGKGKETGDHLLPAPQLSEAKVLCSRMDKVMPGVNKSLLTKKC